MGSLQNTKDMTAQKVVRDILTSILHEQSGFNVS